MSLIDGPEWDKTTRDYATKLRLPGVDARPTTAKTAHTGGRLRFVGDGPADIEVLVGDKRCAFEVKAWTNGRRSFELVKIKRSQAEDMDAADAAALVLRWPGRSAADADFVFMLDWSMLGPLWWRAHRGEAKRGDNSLSQRDCMALASNSGPVWWWLVEDDHGDWSCPDFIGTALATWGFLEDGQDG